MQKDNSTFLQKVNLRRLLLRECADPVVMETHGGLGKIWQACYSHIERGIVMEKDQKKAAVLAKQRPSWAVYQCDSVPSIAAGAGAHLPINFVDVDPYGDPWPILDAFLTSKRDFPDRLCIAVNDGLRNKLKATGGWDVASMADAVAVFGNRLYGRYLELCEWQMQQKAAKAGYSLDRFRGYYCGANKDMTHYAAILSRTGASS